MGAQEVLVLKSERKEDMDHKVYGWEPSTACEGKQTFPGVHEPPPCLTEDMLGDEPVQH